MDRNKPLFNKVPESVCERQREGEIVREIVKDFFFLLGNEIQETPTL